MKKSIIIADGCAPALRAAGLDTFERVMAFEAPRSAVTRAVPGRFTARVELLVPAQSDWAAADGTRVVYLKRYRRRGAVVAGGAGAAGHEWRRLLEAALAGIPCPRPMAWGERRGLFGAVESFLITAEIAGAEQADWWVEENRSRTDELIEGIADLARRFHQAGFHHRDLYLCHFFVRAPGGAAAAEGPLELFLIDFQRCGRLRGGGVNSGGSASRWLVKDLAQLHFSLGQVGLAEKWDGFLERYGGVGPAMRRAILKKSARIARHVPRYG